jgi:ribosomal protein S12 methylthiotransferase
VSPLGPYHRVAAAPDPAEGRPVSSAPPSAPARVAIVTLGCGRNEVDSDQLAGLFLREGMQVVEEVDEADVVLVNTCTFIAPAKEESVDTVLAACDLKDSSARGVVVVGCMAQRYPQDLADSIPEADAVVGFSGYPALPGLVGDILAGRAHDRVVGVTEDTTPAPARRGLPLVSVGSGPAPAPAAATTTVASDAPWVAPVPEAPRDDADVLDLSTQDALDRVPATGPRFPVRTVDPDSPWAYLKIASGCDRLCTFCAIPSFRGRFRSRPIEEILAEAAWLSSQGVRELVLVSENTTSWGKDLPGFAGRPGGRDLQATLLRELADVEGIERLRLMYLQPAELRPELLEAMAGIPAVAPYFDLSLQHVSAPVLTRMARSGSPERFGALVERIRELAPEAAFRSNFILGFPGETEDDVGQLEAFLDEHELDWVGLFPFSREDGTPSDHLPDQVDPDVARARVERIASVQERAADRAAARHVGRSLDVLVEAHLRDPGGDEVVEVVGRSAREAPDTDGEVRLVGPAGQPIDAPVGRMVRARVVDHEGVDLVAEVDGR